MTKEQFSRDEIEEILLRTIPEKATPPNPYLNKDAYQGLDWTAANELFRQVGMEPHPYDLIKWNCADNSAWFISEVKRIWADKSAPDSLPLAIFKLEGDVPKDGANAFAGWHSIGVIVDRTGKAWLFGCYERSVMNDSAWEQIKDVEYVGAA